jgi:hypothetical protein
MSGKSKVTRLRELVDALDDLLDWYEDEHERSCYGDGDVPAELVDLEQAVYKARAALEGEAT